MSDQYEGNPALFPDDYTIPDDGEDIDALAVNVAFEALGDRTAYLLAHAINIDFASETDLSAAGTVLSGSEVAPANAVGAILRGAGAGGGGAGGPGNPGYFIRASGGGAGGGALEVGPHYVPIVGGETYNWVVGEGGARGTRGAPVNGGDLNADPTLNLGTNGEDGGDTTYTRATGPVELFRARGGGKGMRGLNAIQPGITTPTNPIDSTPALFTWGRGGAPCRESFANSDAMVLVSNSIADMYRDRTPQAGGSGVTGNSPYTHQGNPSPQGFKGGNGGSSSSTNATGFFGGGGGGGAGAGAYEDGFAGGDGGQPNDAGGPINAGLNGAAASDGSSAGGSGGGASGAGSDDTVGNGGHGGKGGSGRLYRTWVIRGVLP